jgi:hypothetical protein
VGSFVLPTRLWLRISGLRMIRCSADKRSRAGNKQDVAALLPPWCAPGHSRVTGAGLKAREPSFLPPPSVRSSGLRPFSHLVDVGFSLDL